ncbi:MAG: type IV pilin [Nanoarchaeota archaeon]
MLKKNSKGISNVLSTLLLIAIAVIAVAIVASFAINFVNDNLSNRDTCFNALDKVKLQSQYTCNTSSKLFVGVETGDVKLDKLLISLSGGGSVKSIEINGSANNNYLIIYGNSTSKIVVPGANGGITYQIDIYNAGIPVGSNPYKMTRVDSVSISPKFGTRVCDAVDQVQIVECDPSITS